jgi:hypothetical protein
MVIAIKSGQEAQKGKEGVMANKPFETKVSWRPSHFTTDGHSTGLSCCRAPFDIYGRILGHCFEYYDICNMERPL